MVFVALKGELHAAAGPPGPAGGSDEERPEEEGHRLSLGAAGTRGLHLAGQRDVGLHLRESPAVPVQSESPRQRSERRCRECFFSSLLGKVT